MKDKREKQLRASCIKLQSLQKLYQNFSHLLFDKSKVPAGHAAEIVWPLKATLPMKSIKHICNRETAFPAVILTH